MDFEKKLKEIEEIAAKLQKEEIGIKEGISLFEQSVELTKECLEELNESKQKIDNVKRELDRLLEARED